MRTSLTVWVLTTATLIPGLLHGLTDAELNRIQGQFEERARQLFERQHRNPYPNAGPEDSKLYGWNRLNYALATLMLGVDDASANRAVQAAIRGFLSEPNSEALFFGYEGLQWQTPLLGRIYHQFGPDGSRRAGVLTAETLQQIRYVFLAWAQQGLVASDTNPDKIWTMWGSENLDLVRDYTCWQATRILAEAPDYRHLPIRGVLPARHHAAWTAFIGQYLRERLTRGLLVEIASPDYGKYVLQVWHNLYDFGPDPLSGAAEEALDLWWAQFALEQIDGVRGGSKHRAYQRSNDRAADDGSWWLTWFYTGDGGPRWPHPAVLPVATSDYRIPTAILRPAIDEEARGRLSLRSRHAGWGDTLRPQNRFSHVRVNPERTFIRSTWVTPALVMGASMTPRIGDDAFANISDQNRWAGIIFAGHPDARLYPECVGLRNRKTYNQHMALHHEDTLIVQRLPDGLSKQAGPMRIYVAPMLRRVSRQPGADAGWTVFEAAEAWAAVRPAAGGMRWESETWLRPEKPDTPVVLVAIPKTDMPSVTAFRERLSQRQPGLKSGWLRTRTLLSNTRLDFPYVHPHVPRIDGQPVAYDAGPGYASPLVRNAWGADRLEWLVDRD
ncbi:MAG: hypothetical protein ACFE0O_08175 [Opitutales bacterium]